MKQLNLNYNEKLNYDDILKAIKSSPLGVNLIKELNLSDKEIYDNYELINNYIKVNSDYKLISKNNEKNSQTKGYKYGIKRDIYGNLTDYFYISDEYKDYYKRKNNLILTTFDEELILNDNNKNFIMDNVKLLGMNFIRSFNRIDTNETTGAFLTLKNSKLRLKLIQSMAYRLLDEHQLGIVKFSDLLQLIKADFNSQPITFTKALDVKILIIDGLGNESITSWSRDEILLSLLDNRIQNNKITIICSEYDLESLELLYSKNHNDDIKAKQVIEKINEIKK